MRKRHLILLVVVLGQLGLIAMRYQSNGGFKGPVTSRVHKLENGFRDAVREIEANHDVNSCLLYTSPSPRDATLSRMPSSA